MSGDDGNAAWFDPRLTVFIIWGIFVVLFVCIPSKRIVQRIFTLMGCSCCAYEEEVAPTNGSGGHEMHYEILSSARKQEIDSLRASHLTYRLHPFSLTLEKKHMLRRISENETTPTSQNGDNNSQPQDRIPGPGEESAGNSSGGDVEMGFVRGMDPPEQDNAEEENKEEEDSQYTHVLIPQPGHNFDDIDVLELGQSSTDKEKKVNTEEKKPKLRLFGGKAGKGDGAKESPDATTTKTIENGSGTSKRRSCPIFCAICLAEYEPSERVSWSSNPDCTHAFHEDCVVEWLVSLGRTKSKSRRFADEPTEGQLLDYHLECPCCRQEFVSRGRCDLPAVCGEESA